MTNRYEPDSPPPAIDPYGGPKRGGDTIHGDVRAILSDYEDAFNNLVSARTNVLDIAAHYPYSPERWRLFVDGSRVFPEYNSVSQYNHATDRHELQPAAGETVTFETAERPRYVVQYELESTMAFTLNQSLTSGDEIRVGLYDGSDGWYMEQRGADHTDTQADFIMERNGSTVYQKQDIDIKLATTTFGRLKLQTGWYDVTRQIWERSFPEDTGDSRPEFEFTQRNPVLGKFGAPTSKGSRTGNLPIHFEVVADSSTSGLILEAGSVAQVNLGTTTPQKRVNTAIETASIGTANTWVPLFALRVDPDRDITNVQLTGVAIREFGTSADVTVAAISCDPSNVLDSNDTTLGDADYSAPGAFSGKNSVLEITTAVDEFPDSSGTTVTSTNNPGGWQVAYDVLRTGTGNSITNAEPTPGVKRPLYGRDTVVFLGNAGGTADVTVEYRVEEDW